jgi:type IV secretion system protein VirB11
MLDAFSTGHSGGFATIHANGAAEVLTRLARLARCNRQLISEAIDLVLYVERMPDGRRAVTQIKELGEAQRSRESATMRVKEEFR